MARVSSTEKTLAYLKEVGDSGATIEEILRLGFHRATFFRHRKAINSNGEHYIETFLDAQGIKKYRLRTHKTTLERFSGTVFPSDVKIGSVSMTHGTQKMLTDKSWMESLQNQLEKPFQFTIDNPTYDSNLLTDKHWETLEDSIQSKRAIRIHQYECPTWETFPVESPIIFPLSVLVMGEQHYLHGLWIQDDRFTQVHLNLAGILSYSQVRTYTLPEDIGTVLPRWKWYIVGIQNMVNRISSEVWHSTQFDITRVDTETPWEQLNYFANLSLLGMVEGFQLDESLYDTITKGGFKMVRILPLVNELTVQSIHKYKEDVVILHQG